MYHTHDDDYILDILSLSDDDTSTMEDCYSTVDLYDEVMKELLLKFHYQPDFKYREIFLDQICPQIRQHYRRKERGFVPAFIWNWF